MNDGVRPDPDALVERLREEEQKATRGKLRIYFGSSAGVGKTYAMLLAARALKGAGTDVVAGVIETHGRTDTAAQQSGLEVLPRKAGTAGATAALLEFDLDAALARKPALLLVDELAHTNLAGSRHPKRWQDVEELLGAGIDVWTTLNVQHLESLNDVVGGITGIRVNETLPDTFFDRADEIVLVDTPADELLARLKAGKVYGEAQAERAAANFFRKGNLMALRELALRRTADRVESDVQTWRSDRSIERVWKTESAILCCIGADGAEHVVRSAALLAQQLAVSWHAIYVETPGLQRLPESRRSRILAAVKLAEELGATTAIVPGAHVARTVVDYARQHNLSKLVMGHNRASLWRPAGTLAQQLGRLAADVDLIETGVSAARGGRAAAADTRPAFVRGRRFEPAGYAAALLACGVGTALVLPLAGALATSNIVMLYLLAVVAVALRYGRSPAAFAALVNVVAFDYFVVPPTLSFAVADLQYLISFAVMLTVGLVVGQLTAGLRYQARVAMHREQRSHSLFEVARALSGELVVEQVVETATEAIAREFHAVVRIYVLAADDRLTLAGAEGDSPGLDAGTARWAFDHRQAAGLGTDTIPGSPWHYLPLNASMRTRGVLALQPESPRLLGVPEQRRQLETFAALTAIALERIHYVDVAQQATVQIESERLRNSLLGALSHDLRTPLAGLMGLAETLQMSEPLSEAQAEVVRHLRVAAARMSTQVNNLLDMARIESGDVHLRLEWQSIEELVGSAARLGAGVLAPRRLEVDVPDDLPLVRCDAVLIERVLVNLLENAAKYTPPEALVRVAAQRTDRDVTITVADDGPGIVAGQEEAIFAKFARGVRESSTSGVGLGLAICKSIVEAHGGTIRAANGPGGGALFAFTLPLADAAPPLAAEAEAVASPAR